MITGWILEQTTSTSGIEFAQKAGFILVGLRGNLGFCSERVVPGNGRGKHWKLILTLFDEF
jgi:hypothetical protein